VFDDVPIEFREGGNGVRYCASGWSAPEEWGTWNDGTAAELIFRSSGNEVTAELTLAVVAHVDAEHPRQRLLLETADDSSTIVLDGAGPHQLSIKPLFLGARPQLVRLGFPDAWSPAVDRRRLAVGLISASVNVSA